MTKFRFFTFSCTFFITLAMTSDLYSQYQEYNHIIPPAGVVPVSGTGSYGRPGTTYMLTHSHFK
ncbi:MAG: hypothetical protein GXO83_06935 [Chlorobi bacterium]|nr:hypothetical protein [Chlorobiota bacterium]